MKTGSKALIQIIGTVFTVTGICLMPGPLHAETTPHDDSIHEQSDDPFAEAATEDPVGGDASGSDPFGGGVADEDPFGDNSGGQDPFDDRDGPSDSDPFADPQTAKSKTTSGSKPAKVRGAKRMEAELNKHTRLDFVETPLEEVVEIVKDQHGDMPIVIDHAALELAGLSSEDVLITQELDDVSLRAALCVMLRPFDLTVVVTDEILFVTTVEESEQQLRTKVYPIIDLVDSKKPETVSKSVNMLLDAIHRSVSPESWESVGGTGSMSYFRGHLIVSQADSCHAQLDRLFLALRESIDAHGGLNIPLPSPQEINPSMGQPRNGAGGMGMGGYGMEGGAYGGYGRGGYGGEDGGGYGAKGGYGGGGEKGPRN